MTKEVNHISPDMDATAAIALLQKMQISGLPVVDENNKLIGMFTEHEILSNILPSYIQNVGAFVYENSPKVIKDKVNAFSGLKVRDIMRKDLISVNEDTSIYEVARLMLTKKARRIPVVNKDNQIVGIIARVDLVKALFS